MLIAQLTDTHIRPSGERIVADAEPAELLARCISRINALVPQPDAVLLTGDMADSADQREYAQLRDVLAGLKPPFWLIPGNHDTREAVRSAFPERAELFDDREFLHYVVDRFPVRLIGLDTLVPGEPGGELCEQRLHWLEARLSERPRQDTLLFMHHPPVTVGMPHMDAMRARGGTALADVLGRHRQVRHILCGHVHRPIQTQCGGVPLTIGPSTSHTLPLDMVGDAETLSDEPRGFGLIMLNDSGRTTAHFQCVDH